VLAERDTLITLLGTVDCDPEILADESLTFTKVMEILHGQGGALANLQECHFTAIIETLAYNNHLASEFTPDRFQGDLLLFTATIDQRQGMPTTNGWLPYVEGTIETHLVASSHEQMMKPSGPLAQIGVVLAAKLDEIASTASLSHRG
jgi:nonribosomal peptide synthetase DhbF